MNLGDNAKYLAQAAHVGWGIALTLILAHWLPTLLSASIVTIFAGTKESIESIWGAWEPKQPWSSAIEDFSFWIAGIVIAGLVLLT